MRGVSATGPHDEQSMEALGRYVQQRRNTLPDPTIRWACYAAGISPTKWIAVEKARGPHSKITLRKVARALGESPRHLFDLAGIAYDEAEVQEEVTDDDESRIARLEAEVATQRDQLAELTRRVGVLRLPGEPRGT